MKVLWAGSLWLLLLSVGFAQTSDPIRITKVDPASIKVNEETTITVEATVTTAEALIPNSITLLRYNASNEVVANFGLMFDDGTNGDQVAGDRIYTRRITVKETLVGSLLLKASVAYRGQMRRLVSAAQEIRVTSSGSNNLSLTILEPLDNATVNEDTVTVIGRFEGPAGVGIALNGEGVATTGNQFAAVLNLSSGENKFTVTASVINGASVEKAITVTRSAVESNLRVAATEQEGLAPLRIGYVTYSADIPINKIEVDFDGDGTFDATSTDPKKPIFHVFEQAGLYQSIVQVTDAQQQRRQKKIAIVVQSKEEIEQTIRSLWGEFLQAFSLLGEASLQSRKESFTTEATGPLDPVIGYLSGEARTVYGSVLRRLPRNDVLDIVSFLSTQNLVPIRITTNIAELGVNRIREGKKIAFIITYIKGEDGIWRLKAY